MDITPNRYDALILRLANLSPLVRHTIDGERYRLRMETDEVESETVLQECILALRDDLAEIGLYFTCPLGEVYADFTTLAQVLDVFEYILPNAFYPKLRVDTQIRPQLQAMLTGGVGDDATILLFLRWLGSGPDCYVPTCEPGAQWLVGRLSNTATFDAYLTKLIEVEATLGKPIALEAGELLNYTGLIRAQARTIYDTLNLFQDLPEFIAELSTLRRRIELYIRYLLQPAHIAENAWLRLTDPATLSADMQLVYQQRWREFAQGHRLYGAHYLRTPAPKFTSLAVLGVALRLYTENPDRTRADFLQAFNQECQTNLSFTIPLRSLLLRIVAILYPAATTLE